MKSLKESMPSRKETIDPAMALSVGLEPEEEKTFHLLKAELLGIMGDNEPTYIARNIFYNGHNEAMKRAGIED